MALPAGAADTPISSAVPQEQDDDDGEDDIVDRMAVHTAQYITDEDALEEEIEEEEGDVEQHDRGHDYRPDLPPGTVDREGPLGDEDDDGPEDGDDEPFLASEGEDDDDDQFADEADIDSLDDNPEYPVLLTAEQRRSALALHQALGVTGTDTSTLLPLLHALVLSLFMEQIPTYATQRFHTAVEAFLLAINSLPSGGIRRVVLISPDLSKIQYTILFSILKEALAAPDFATKLAELGKYFSITEICVFAALRYYQQLVWKEVIDEVGLARLLFYPNSPKFEFDDIGSSVLDWIDMVHKLWHRADHILRHDLLLDTPPEDFGFTDEIKEAIRNHHENFGFAASISTGRQEDAFKKIMQRLWANPRFFAMRDETSPSKLHRRHSFRWLLAVQEFKEIMFFMLHIPTGGPRRTTEELLTKLFNTPMRPRNLFWMLQRMFIIGDYSKTSAITGKDKKTVHVIPLALHDMFRTFFMVVIPVEMYFLREWGVKLAPNAHCYLFSSMGKRWGRDYPGKIIRKFTRKYTGYAFGINQVRHIIPSIIAHYNLTIQPHESASSHHVVEQMQGHGHSVASRLYGVTKEFGGQVTKADVLDVMTFSDVLHRFFGLGNREGPVAVTAEDLLKLTQSPMARQLAALATSVSDLSADVGVFKQQLLSGAPTNVPPQSAVSGSQMKRKTSHNTQVEPDALSSTHSMQTRTKRPRQDGAAAYVQNAAADVAVSVFHVNPGF
ncbi:hypothetical protein B0H15DRAFT_803368 [Mycena belliarum]|uniref:Uncharacterized protein n=1 Tax=Mycena belliarum TaxID=1033014 RepID=A0AAD6TWS1_9AGAR|nr:hypothetical protein B0H15DRAFT_803368 [Mycena belliae]